MIKKVFGHGLIYTIANLLTRGISFLLLPFYTRVLNPIDYGLLDIITLIVAFVSLTITLEVTQAIARYVHDLSLPMKVRYVSTAFNFTVIVYVLFSIVFYMSESLISPFIFEGNVKDKEIIYKLIVMLLFFNGLFSFLQSQLRWNLQVKENAVGNVLNAITTIGVTLVLVLGLDLGVIGVIIGLISGNIIGSFFAYYCSRNLYRLLFDREILRKLISFSLPLVPSSIAVFFNLYIDRIIIKNHLGLESVGLYAVAYKFASIISLVIVGFQSSLTPLIYANYKNEDTPASIEKIFRIFLFFIMVMGSGITIFSNELLVLFTHENYYSASILIPTLTFATVFSSLYIFTPGMAIMKKTKIILLINIIVVTINVILSLFLVQRFGLYGVSVALLISNFVAFLLYIRFSQRLYRIPFRFKPLIITLLVMITLLIGVLFLEGFVSKVILYLITIAVQMGILFSKSEVKETFNKLRSITLKKTNK